MSKRRKNKKGAPHLPLGVLIGLGTESAEPSARIVYGDGKQYDKGYQAAVRFVGDNEGVTTVEQEFDTSHPGRPIGRVRFRRDTEDSA